MDEVETEYLETQRFKPLVLLRFINDIFFIWTYGKENLQNFMNDLNNFRNSINFLDFNVKLNHKCLYKTYRLSSIPTL